MAIPPSILHSQVPHNGHLVFEKAEGTLALRMDRFNAEVIHAGNLWEEKFQFLGLLTAHYEGLSRVMLVGYTSPSLVPEEALMQKIFELAPTLARHVFSAAFTTHGVTITENCSIDSSQLLDNVCDLDALLATAKRINNVGRIVRNHNLLRSLRGF